MQNSHLSELTFSQLNLVDDVQAALASKDYNFCTPIQALSLPHLLDGKDVAGEAQTGTGKTLAFLTATFNRLLTNGKTEHDEPRAIIMAPTRELAVQIFNDAQIFLAQTSLRAACIYGGEGYDEQKQTLEDGTDILIGTTGRIIDYYKQHLFSLDYIEVLVLDEADRMFDLGFIKDIRYLLRRMPKPAERLSMLFSATLSYRVQELGYEHMNNPIHVQVASEKKTAAKISEELFYPSHEDKMRLLLTLLEEEWPDKGIVFANTKHACETVAEWMKADGHRVGLLSGDVPQKKRLSILQKFTQDELDFLVATDVAARGLHIDNVTHVFNYDLPDDAADYVHRIGRTGRAGSSGIAISFACENYAMNLTAIEEYIGHALPVTNYDSGALLTDITPPKPKQRRQNNNRGRNQGGRGRRPSHKANDK